MISHSRPSISQKELGAVNSVLNSGFLAQGKVVSKFEKEFARFIGSRYALAVNSGSSSLHLSLLALKIKPKDEVIIPSFVCTAVLNAVNYVGAVPVIADININDFNISTDSVKKKINAKTKAVIVAHMFGQPADLTSLLKLNVPIIEDLSLSVGAEYKNKKVGSFGKISICSFYATKMLTSIEGGMFTTSDSRIFSYVKDLRDYDNKKDYRIRYNYKMSDVNAAIGLVQLKRLNKFISRRQSIAKVYNKGLQGLDIKFPSLRENTTHTYFRYIIRTKKNIIPIIKQLQALGIEAKQPIYKPLHNYLGLSDKCFPATKEAYKTSISLPIYPALTNNEVVKIVRDTSIFLKEK